MLLRKEYLRFSTLIILILLSLLYTLPSFAQEDSVVTDDFVIPDGYELVGDMLVPTPPEGEITPAGGYVTNTWPTSGVIPYIFDSSVSADDRAIGIEAMNKVEALSGVDFVPFSSLTGWTQGYFTFYTDPSVSGGVATLGYSSFNNTSHFVKIGPGDWGLSILVHELGHVLGIIHEQQRADRDTYIQVFYGNIDADNHDQFDTFGSSPTVGDYDFASVMHYSKTALFQQRARYNRGATSLCYLE